MIIILGTSMAPRGAVIITPTLCWKQWEFCLQIIDRNLCPTMSLAIMVFAEFAFLCVIPLCDFFIFLSLLFGKMASRS